MKQFVSIAVFLLFSMSGMSQTLVPGYQGKRVSFGLHYAFFGTYSQPNENGNSGLTAFNSRIGAELNIVRSRTTELVLSYDYLQTRMKVRTFVEAEPVGSNKNIDFEVQSHMTGIGSRLYLGEYIAPLGSYVKFGVGFINNKVTDIDDDFDYYVDGLQSVNINQGFLDMEIGTQGIHWGRITTNVGVQGVYVYGTKWMNGGLPSNSDDLLDDTRQRVRDHLNLNVKLGVGLLF